MEIRPCYSKGQIFINHQILNENPLPNENQACEGGTQRVMQEISKKSCASREKWNRLH